MTGSDGKQLFVDKARADSHKNSHLKWKDYELLYNELRYKIHV
jgi:hypothetical protein